MLQNDTHIKLQLLGCLQNTQFNINIKRLRVGYIKILGTLCIFLYIYNSSNCDTSRWVGKRSGLELCLWYPQTSHSLPMLLFHLHRLMNSMYSYLQAAGSQIKWEHRSLCHAPAMLSQSSLILTHTKVQQWEHSLFRCQRVSLSLELSNLLFSSDKPF